MRCFLHEENLSWVDGVSAVPVCQVSARRMELLVGEVERVLFGIFDFWVGLEF